MYPDGKYLCLLENCFPAFCLCRKKQATEKKKPGAVCSFRLWTVLIYCHMGTFAKIKLLFYKENQFMEIHRMLPFPADFKYEVINI